MKESHYKRLEHAYLTAAINRQVYPDTSIAVQEGRAEINWKVSPKFFHGMNALHGSVYFKLLDDACFFAVNSVVLDVFVLTVSFEIDFHRPVGPGDVRAEGRLIHASKNLWIARGELTDARGKIAAMGTGRFVKSKIPLIADASA